MATGELILPLDSDLRLAGFGARAATTVTFDVGEGTEIRGSPPSGEVPFSRYYASMLAREGLASGHLGPNWLGTYDWSLSVVGSDATLVTNRGAAHHFAKNTSGTWDLVGPLHAKVRMEEHEAGYDVVVDSRVYAFSKNSGLLASITDARGNALTLSYTGSLLQQVTDGLGRTLTFGYNANGLLTSVGDGTRTVGFGYTDGLLTSATDAGGHTWTYTYSNPGPVQIPALLEVVTEPLGNTPIVHTYDAMGRVASQADALNNVATYEYDTALGSTFTDPVGDTWAYLHDASGRLVSRTDPAAGVTSYTYDALGRLETRTRPLGDVASLAYDPQSGYPSSLTFPSNVAFGWGYSTHLVGGITLFDLASASYPDGTSETFGRDQAGNLTDFTDRAGHHWTATYNQQGQYLTSTNPAGGTTAFAYDPEGRLATVTDHAQNATQYAYDALDRLLLVTHPDTWTRAFTYDPLDRLTSLTDERGKIWTYAYDSNGRLTSATDPLQHSNQYVYDALDRLTQVVDALGHVSVYAYDAAGRLASFTDRTGHSTSFAYDRTQRQVHFIQSFFSSKLQMNANDRLTGAGNPLNQTWSLEYDLLERVSHVSDPLGNGIDYGYDAMGRLTSLTAPLGHTETFAYDSRGLLTSFLDVTSETGYTRTPLGQVSTVTDPNLSEWSRTHDSQGRLTSTSDPLGRTTTFGYDSRSRPVQVNRPDGIIEHIIYDRAVPIRIGGSFDGDLTNTVANLNFDDAMRLESATGASFGYDAADRMTSCNGLTMTYDDEGRITSVTYAPGKVVSYAYDARGLLSQVTDWVDGNTTFGYDAAGRLNSMTRPNGVAASYEYDAAGRLTLIVDAGPPNPGEPIASIAMTRDALGRPTSIDRRQPLMPAVTAPSTIQLTYDAASQVQGLNWDPLGRLVSDGSRVFEWDALSRLTRYAAGADSPRITCDALGRVLTRSQGAQAESYVWNYATMRPTLATVNPGPPAVRYFVYTPAGLLLYSVDGSTGARRFYHYDEEGNTIFLTNDGGSVVAEYAYKPFGDVTALGQTADNPFTFGAARGMIALGSSGLWASGPLVYDDRTMRVISGNAVQPEPSQSPFNMVAVRLDPSDSPFVGGIAFFRSIGGLKTESEVGDYSEGGYDGTIRRLPGGLTRLSTGPRLYYRAASWFAGGGQSTSPADLVMRPPGPPVRLSPTGSPSDASNTGQGTLGGSSGGSSGGRGEAYLAAARNGVELSTAAVSSALEALRSAARSGGRVAGLVGAREGIKLIIDTVARGAVDGGTVALAPELIIILGILDVTVPADVGDQVRDRGRSATYRLARPLHAFDPWSVELGTPCGWCPR